VVPGISAALGAAARLGVSLTHRDHARRVQFVTGHAKDGRLPADIDWPSIADPAATTAVYMPGKTLAEFMARAVAHGLTPDMPAVAIAQATRPNEQRIAATIADMPARLAGESISGPLLLLIGRVFGERLEKIDTVGEAPAKSA
jgi:uroporphyrin-III C-methyltransferase/precorrin-2 dehydrogenase/sirohydrochlorin ferrochelatase